MPKESLVITDGQAEVRVAGRATLSVPVDQLIGRILAAADWGPAFPDVIPPTVRWIQRRAGAMCVITELQGGPRTVRWITENSPAPFGPEAEYQERRLSFPFCIMPLLFHGEQLADARLYYRNEPLTGRPEEAELCFPCLLNVSDIPGTTRKTWFCTQYLSHQLAPLGFYDKLQTAGNHLVFSGFNESSEFHEKMSYWSDEDLHVDDKRLATVEAWEKATRKDPNFAITVAWRPAGATVADIVSELLGGLRAERKFASSKDLIDLAHACGTPE